MLLALARDAIAKSLGIAAAPFEDGAHWLRRPGACFITLKQAGELRGCIGTLEAHRTLGEDVKANAVAAAFRDPRFKPLALAEFETTRVEVSLLSALEPLGFHERARCAVAASAGSTA